MKGIEKIPKRKALALLFGKYVYTLPKILGWCLTQFRPVVQLFEKRHFGQLWVTKRS